MSADTNQTRFVESLMSDDVGKFKSGIMHKNYPESGMAGN
jgi:hypothetical protein